MRSCILAVIAAAVLSIAASLHPLYAQEPTHTTLSAGWSWPADGPVADSYKSGFMLAGSFRTAIAPNTLYGLEVGYTWLSLDSDKLAGENPGSNFSGGNMGLLSITGENDVILGTPGSTMRPFINSGLGFFRSFIDDATVTTGSTTSRHSTGVYKGSFFGFHVGIGALINRDRFGLRIDANYHYLFSGGKDLSFFPIRAGIIFYP